MGYLKRGLTAFKDLKNNMVLFIPNLIMLFTTIITSIILYQATGINQLLNPDFYTQQSTDKLLVLQEFWVSNWIRLVVSAALFVATNFFVGVGVAVTRYNLISQILDKKKAKFKEAWANKGRFIWKVVGLKILTYIIGAGAIGLASIASLVIIYQIKSLSVNASLIFASVMLLLSLIFVKLILFFMYPITFIKKDATKIFSIAKESFGITVKHPRAVFITWVITLIVGVLIRLAVLGLNYLSGSFKKSVYISLIAVLLIVALNLVYGLWSDLFVFRNYKELNL